MSKRLLVILAAVIGTVATFYLASLLGADLVVPEEFGDMSVTMEMPVGVVVGFTFVIGLVAWALATILERATSNARNIWTFLAVVALAGSIPGVYQLGLEGADLVWQVLLHVVFGAILIAGFYGTFPSNQDDNPASDR